MWKSLNLKGIEKDNKSIKGIDVIKGIKEYIKGIDVVSEREWEWDDGGVRWASWQGSEVVQSASYGYSSFLFFVGFVQSIFT